MAPKLVFLVSGRGLVKDESPLKGRHRIGGKGASHRGSHWTGGTSADSVENYRTRDFWLDQMKQRARPAPGFLTRYDYSSLKRIFDEEIVGVDSKEPMGREITTPAGVVWIRRADFKHCFVQPGTGDVLREDKAPYIRYLVPTLSNPIEIWDQPNGRRAFLSAYQSDDDSGRHQTHYVIATEYMSRGDVWDMHVLTHSPKRRVDSLRANSKLVWAEWHDGEQSKGLVKAALEHGTYEANKSPQQGSREVPRLSAPTKAQLSQHHELMQPSSLFYLNCPRNALSVFRSALTKARASGYPLQDRAKFQGLDISVENKAGTWREDKKHDPPTWRTLMKYPYGYIKGSESAADGDHIDCYLGPHEDAPFAYVVDQVDPETGEFDEQKVMLGFLDADTAREAYLAHYDDPAFFGDIFPLPMEEFKRQALASLGAGGTVLVPLDEEDDLPGVDEIDLMPPRILQLIGKG